MASSYSPVASADATTSAAATSTPPPPPGFNTVVDQRKQPQHSHHEETKMIGVCPGKAQAQASSFSSNLPLKAPRALHRTAVERLDWAAASQHPHQSQQQYPHQPQQTVDLEAVEIGFQEMNLMPVSPGLRDDVRRMQNWFHDLPHGEAVAALRYLITLLPQSITEPALRGIVVDIHHHQMTHQQKHSYQTYSPSAPQSVSRSGAGVIGQNRPIIYEPQQINSRTVAQNSHLWQWQSSVSESPSSTPVLRPASLTPWIENDGVDHDLLLTARPASAMDSDRFRHRNYASARPGMSYSAQNSPQFIQQQQQQQQQKHEEALLSNRSSPSHLFVRADANATGTGSRNFVPYPSPPSQYRSSPSPLSGHSNAWRQRTKSSDQTISTSFVNRKPNIGGYHQPSSPQNHNAHHNRGHVRSPITPPPHTPSPDLGNKAEKGRIPDRVDFTLLEDIPAWLRSLRLHKYTALFWPTDEYLAEMSKSDDYCAQHIINTNPKERKFWNWREMVELNDEDLERLGVKALGARRKMIKVFELIHKEIEQSQH